MKKQEKTDTKALGDRFEASVGALYQNLGYRVTYNVQLSGQQIDLLAEKEVPGAGRSKIAIECKFQTKGNINNQKVQDFLGMTENCFRHDGITKAVMITNTGYTSSAWAVAQKNQLIELLTVQSLEDQLFDLSSTYRSFIEVYEHAPIFNDYVELNGSYSGGKPVYADVENIETFLISWLEKPHSQFLTIFGDFGSGKTTMLHRLKYVFAKRYVETNSTLKPFLINLKDFYKYDTLDKLLAYSAIREFEREVSLHLIYRQIESGEIILLLDGFDEMAQQIDAEVRMRNFLYLAPLLQQRALITCRPSYFVNPSEYLNYSEQVVENSASKLTIRSGDNPQKDQLQKVLMNQLAKYLNREYISTQSLKSPDILNFETLEIEVLSPQSIDHYLSKKDRDFKRRLGFGWEYVKEYLLGIYDISDLMTRPMLLEMIVKILLSGMLDLRSKQANIGPSHIYDLDTSTYLDIDFYKGDSRQLFKPDQRRNMAISIALLMLKTTSLEVSYEQLLHFIQSSDTGQALLANAENLTQEQIVADIQICTFLVGSVDEKFRFSHKSFMEFFVAQYLKDQMMKNVIASELNEILPKEILYFLGSYVSTETEIRARILRWLKERMKSAGDKKLLRNLACTLLYADAVTSELKWGNIELSYIDYKRRSLSLMQFNSVNILHAEFVNSAIYNNEWQKVYLNKVNFSDCEFSGSSLSAIIEKVTLKSCTVKKTMMSLLGKDLSYSKCTFNDSSVFFGGSTILERCDFTDCVINWDTTIAGQISFEDCMFEDGFISSPEKTQAFNHNYTSCRFKGQQFVIADTGEPSRNFEKCEFMDCTIEGLRLDHHMIKEFVIHNCSGYVLIEDRAVDNLELAGQLAPFKRMGSMVFAQRDNLYLIPENTWKICERSFTRFEERLAATRDA